MKFSTRSGDNLVIAKFFQIILQKCTVCSCKTVMMFLQGRKITKKLGTDVPSVALKSLMVNFQIH